MAAEPVCVQDIENIALRKLSENVRSYYRSGADQEETLADNRRAFSRFRLRPRVLRDVSRRQLDVTVLGQRLSFPVGVSPSAMQRMAHPDGEVATVRAAASMDTVMILSTISTTSIEDVAAAAPDGLRWFQLYIYKDRKVTEELVRRAEHSGFRALVLTVDTPMFGQRLQDVRNKFTLPPHLKMANFQSNDEKSVGIQSSKSGSGLNEYATSLFDPSISWKDIQWLKSITRLPIVAKGILTGEDAVLALEHGVSAIMVSNHGGRQLDGVPATIEALPEIVQAVNGRCEVYLDGGVRTGTDVLKALALGAKAVFVGRPAVWGLAYKGEEGVRRVLEILRNELSLAMALSGCAKVSDISSSMIVRDSYYSRL